MKISKIAKLILLPLLFSVAMTVSGFAQGSVQDGMDAFKAKEYQKALKIFQPLAENNDPTSQYFMGIIYEYGYDVKKSYKTAAQWYEKAADQGDEDAQANLAELYQNGKGVKKDMNKAILLYLKAISKNSEYATSQLSELIKDNSPSGQERSNAFLMVAKLYRDGKVAEAIKSWKYLAEKGDRDSQAMLGELYISGQDGLEQSYQDALMWYTNAAVQGSAHGQYGLGVIFGNGWGVERNDNLARFWFQQSSDNGNQQATEALKIF